MRTFWVATLYDSKCSAAIAIRCCGQCRHRQERYRHAQRHQKADKSFLHRGSLTFFGPEVELRQKWMLLLP